MLSEIIVTNLDEAKLAQSFGAKRLELINSFDFGGMTPDMKLIKEVTENINIPVNVMLRSTNSLVFNYSQSELYHMLEELEFIKTQTKANGIVFGALDNKGNIDIPTLKTIIKHKGHLRLTFHRAVDVAKDTLTAYKQLLEIPEVDLVLTSGGAKTALEGIDSLQKMVALSNHHTNAQIIAASGITPENAILIINKTQVKEIHLGNGVRKDNILNKDLFDNLNSYLETIEEEN